MIIEEEGLQDGNKTADIEVKLEEVDSGTEKTVLFPARHRFYRCSHILIDQV